MGDPLAIEVSFQFPRIEELLNVARYISFTKMCGIIVNNALS